MVKEYYAIVIIEINLILL